MRSVLPLALAEAPLGGGVDLTRYVLVCVGILAAVVACAWLLRRFLAEGLKRRAARRSLAVLDVLPLGRRQRLVVVRCYDRTFLIGMGEKELRRIAELEAEAGAEDAPLPRVATASEGAGAPSEESFAETLAREVVPRPSGDPAEATRELLRGGILG